MRGFTGQSWLFWLSVTMILWAAIVGVIAWSIIRQQNRPECGGRPADYGISFRRGGVASLAIVALIHIFLAIGGKLALSGAGNLALRVWGVFMEELTFRSIAIDKLVLLMDGIKRRAFWAIVASSMLWSIPHIPSRSPAQVLGGIFLGGLFFGLRLL